ncbi:hypothetical protein HDV03_004402 [Kappamyces sp. JEL0829]|nr:hypothetical protein HDV03_004402 [Kappamyces sp. JEL0829]
MFDGSMDAARETARIEKKWIIVTIHADSEFSCQVLNRDLWKDKRVKEFIKENFIFCQRQYDDDSPEGTEHVNYYPIENFPYIAILDAETGERVKCWNVLLSSDEFITQCMAGRFTPGLDFLSSRVHPVSERVSKKKKKTNDVARLSEEEQMELAMKASMQGSSMQDVIVIDDDEDDVVLVPAKDESDPTVVFKSIAASTSAESAAPPEKTTRIQIKFPSGDRVVRKFEKTATVASVFAFVKGSYPQFAAVPFELYDHNRPLLLKHAQTLQDANLIGVSLKLDVI